jgi:hypothetical protein
MPAEQGLRQVARFAAADRVAEVPRRPWRVFVAETATGRVVADLPFIGVPQWAYGVNQTGAWSVTVPIGGGNGAMTAAGYEAVADPWRHSVGIAWGGYILQCGPIVTDDYRDSDGAPAVDVAGVGIWGLLTSKRLIASPTWDGVSWADAAADVTVTDVALSTIAKRLVELDGDRNGALPIALPADVPGAAVRTYPAYDLAYVGERLGQLTQVIDGPELEFRPRYTDATATYVEWEMRLGNPRLGDLTLAHSWDYGIGACTRIDVSRDGSRQQLRSVVRGNGMERGLLTGQAEDLAMVAAGWPLLEAVDSGHTSATEQATLDAWATANVETFRQPVTTWAAEVLIDGTNGRARRSGSPSLDTVGVGDTARFTVDGHRRIRPGTYGQRVIGVRSAAGDIERATLTLQGVA